MIRDRQEKIVKLCKIPFTISVLAKELNVTGRTIKNDVDYLVCKGRLKDISHYKQVRILEAI